MFFIKTLKLISCSETPSGENINYEIQGKHIKTDTVCGGDEKRRGRQKEEKKNWRKC